MGTTPPTSQPVCGDRSLEEVLRDRSIGRGHREADTAPSEPGTQSMDTAARLSQGWGPSCGAPRKQQQLVLNRRAPDQEGLRLGQSCWSCGRGARGGGDGLAFLKQCADPHVHQYMMSVADVYARV